MSITKPDTTTDAREAGILDVDDIEAARDDLIRRGVEVSDIWHLEPGEGRVPGLDPERRSYFSRASFADPDGTAPTWTRVQRAASKRRRPRLRGATWPL